MGLLGAASHGGRLQDVAGHVVVVWTGLGLAAARKFMETALSEGAVLGAPVLTELEGPDDS